MNAELEKVLLAQGGLFWLESEHTESTPFLREIVARFSRRIEYAKLRLYKDKPRPIEFGLVTATNLNAFAYATRPGEEPAFDFIGINVGVIFTLLTIFHRMLAHPDVFPEVGNPERESRSLHRLEYLSTDVMRSGHKRLAPVCPVRNIFAGELALVALDFLFFHELTHLRNGHLEFLRNHLSLTHWTEAVGPTTDRGDQMIRQALEVDADCGAILLTLNGAFRMRDALASPSKPATAEALSAIQAAYATSQKAARTVSFSAYVLFRIFDTTEWLWKDQFTQSHPLPPLRMFLIGATIYEIFLQRPEYACAPHEFVAENAETILSAEIACGLIRGDDPDVRGIRSVVDGEQYSPYLERFQAAWTEIRPFLEQYKRGGDLAP